MGDGRGKTGGEKGESVLSSDQVGNQDALFVVYGPGNKVLTNFVVIAVSSEEKLWW